MRKSKIGDGFEVAEAVALFQSRCGAEQPDLAIVLGSGLGQVAEHALELDAELAYGEIPGLPPSTVPYHAGRFLTGQVNGKRVVCMQGRLHLYEGYSAAEVVRPVELLAGLGAGRIVLTNAAGGIRPDLPPASLMLISDHINLMGDNPLAGRPEAVPGDRFVDLTNAWSADWRRRVLHLAQDLHIELKEGVYVGVRGPSFETPAEIRAFQKLGADAVGMSTIPECIMARALGMDVLGISCITNWAAGLGPGHLSHLEVSETARTVEHQFARLLLQVIQDA